MSVTYRDLPKDIDPIDFFFGDEKLTVPESRFTPELTVRFWERTMKMIEIKTLHARSDHNPDGLVSLPTLLRYEAGHYGSKWLRLEAVKGVIGSALPEGTPFQLLYYPIYPFSIPTWNDIPTYEIDEGSWQEKRVMGPVSSAALLFGKNERLYFATAEWQPKARYFKPREEPRYFDHDVHPYIFTLCNLNIQPVAWDDPRILGRIERGKWGNMSSFLAGVQLLLSGTAMILENRAEYMRSVAKILDRTSIFYGR